MKHVDTDQPVVESLEWGASIPRSNEALDTEPGGSGRRGVLDHETSGLLRHHWLGIVAIALICASAVFTWSLFQPKVYEATATGIVVATGAQGDLSEAATGVDLALTQAASYKSLAFAEPVGQAAVAELGLDTDPSVVEEHIVVTVPSDTAEVHITADATTPEEAAALANAWIGGLESQIETIENLGGPASGTAPVLTLHPLSEASPATNPASPNIGLNTALGLLVGLALGLTYAFARRHSARTR